ncbi:hypothetical protein F2P81_023038 [Scophthalmus maximus]|uniref:Uncharacterized protein n=1 Tax=Scophthalmus maximus TaxID=52904 RepID=A0A6A4RNX0_SCOMX|nr:hypothetical protein F2P81_023038 [Scophthalmus maximus]
MKMRACDWCGCGDAVTSTVETGTYDCCVEETERRWQINNATNETAPTLLLNLHLGRIHHQPVTVGGVTRRSRAVKRYEIRGPLFRSFVRREALCVFAGV